MYSILLYIIPYHIAVLLHSVSYSLSHLFRIANGACVSEDKLCNGANDCGDYSDEQTCNVNECTRSIEEALCAHKCEDRKVLHVYNYIQIP